MADIIAVLDANVLFPASLRDTLLRAGEQKLYRPKWTPLILEEMRRNVVAKQKMTELQAQRLVHVINRAFPDGVVADTYQQHIPLLVNDPKDRHVLAAAIEAKAGIIVTLNLSDFPAVAMAPYHIDALSPDAFLLSLLQEAPDTMKMIMRAQAAELRHPPLALSEVLQVLSTHAPQFCRSMQTALKD